MTNKEIGFNKVQELVTRFSEQLIAYKKAEYNETQTRRDFIDPFFKALGWDIDNEQGFAESYREVIHEDKVKVGTSTKAPDYSFRLSGGQRLFFVEAKKPSVLIKEDIHPAYQVRRYGWSAKLKVSVITDFEEFAIYDCTKKPNPTDKSSVARVKYITYNEYLNEWDFLWNTFSKEAVLKGSFDKFIGSNANKKGTATVDKEFLNSLDQWRTLLAETISKENKQLDEDELNFVVQQTLDRIIFLRICEDRSVEPYGKLKDCLNNGNFYDNLLYEFREADDKYNSGLFDFRKDKISSQIKINNKTLKTIINQLYYPECPYEFSVLSVEILGSAYEQFLGKTITINNRGKAVIELKPEVRKAGGVYYTPQYIVDYIVTNTIGKLCENKTPKEVSEIKIVDPACGSGSFLLGAFQYLLNWHKDYYLQHPNKKNPLNPDGNLTTAEKKRILLNNIHGVDIDVNAVEVTKLSLLLKCLEGETQASIAHQLRMFNERVLPTLDNNIKSGNSLIDTDYYDTQLDFGEEKKIKPFSWQKAFPEVFKNKYIEEPLEAFHVTWTTYNARPVGKNNFASPIILDDNARNLISQFLDEKIKTEKFRVLNLNVLNDHIHIIIVSTKDELPEIVRHLKGYSSYMYHKQMYNPAPFHPTLQRGDIGNSDIAGGGEFAVPMLKHRVEEGTESFHPTLQRGDIGNSDIAGGGEFAVPMLKHRVEEGTENLHPTLQRGDNSRVEEELDNAPTQEPTKLWAKDYSHTFLITEEHLLNAFKYIENNHLKHQLNKLDYKFKNLTPLEKAFEKKVVPGGFDVVIGNPPYVNIKELEKSSIIYFYNNFKVGKGQTDLFSLFIEKGISLLNKNGFISYIIPDSINDRSNYKTLREIILKETFLCSILTLNNVFLDAKVGSTVFVSNLNSSNSVELFKSKNLESLFKNDVLKLNTTISEILKNENFSFLFVNINQKQLIEKLYSNKHKLKDIAFLGRGEEIGKNSELIHSVKKANSLLFVSGEDFNRYFFKLKEKFIDKENVKKDIEKLYCNKIIVRQVGKSITANLDEFSCITPQSVYTINPIIDWNKKYILALLNSKLFDYIYKNKFKTKEIFPRILLENLKELPIKAIDFSNKDESHTHDQIVNSVEQLLQLNKDLHSATLETKKEQIKQKIEYHEDKINKLVYQLYDLTEEEIKLVEDSQ